MLEIRPLPKRVIEWIDRVPLKKSRYIFYDYSSRKSTTGYCTHCRIGVMVTGARHHGKGSCPSCRAQVTYIAKGRFRQMQGWTDTNNFSYIQTTKRGFCIRSFIAERWYSVNHFPAVPQNIKEISRVFFENGKITNRLEWSNFRNTGEYRFNRMSGAYVPESYIFPGTLKEIGRRCDKYKYIELDKLARNCGKINPRNMLTAAAKYPWLEYIQKLELWNIAKDISNASEYASWWNRVIKADGKTLKEILGIEKADLSIMKQVNVTIEQLELYQEAKAKGVACDAQTLEWAESKLRGAETLGRVIEHYKGAKTRRWIDKQAEQRDISRYRYNDIIRDWHDYIAECTELGYDLTDDSILMPKDLTIAHARTSAMVEVKNNEKDNRRIKLQAIRHSTYTYEDDSAKLLIRHVADMEELILEGKLLKHCVGGYGSRIAKGETNIFVIRKWEEPDKPFFTLEWHKNKMAQCRGYCNCSMPREVKKFVEKWEAQIKKLRQVAV